MKRPTGMPGPAGFDSASRTSEFMPTEQIEIPEGASFVKVTRTINRPITTIFDCIIDVELTRIFPRGGPARRERRRERVAVQFPGSLLKYG